MRTTPPTAELHVHLEGTLEPETILAMARANGLPAPAGSVEELRARYAFGSLQSFLDVYYANVAVLRTADDAYAMTDAYLRRAARANVRRAEMFLDPQSHTARGVPLAAVLDGVTGAMADHPEVSSGLIACFLRHLGPDAAVEAYRGLAPHLGALLGVGLDSSEAGFPSRLFREVFAMARSDGLHAVAHAGEEGGPENVRDALDALGAERIDHGVRALDDPALVARLAAERVPLTVCPLSNVRLRVVPSLAEHPLRAMLGAGLVVTVNSDDPAYFGGYVDDAYRETAAALALDDDDLRALAVNSFEAAFVDDDERAGWLAEVAAWPAR